jgi:hypothetical protein
VKGVGRDLCEASASWRAVYVRAGLHDLIAHLTTCLALLVGAYRIDPAHVVAEIGIGLAIGSPGHDPDALDSTAFEDPAKVSFALDVLRRNVDPLVAQDLNFRTD